MNGRMLFHVVISDRREKSEYCGVRVYVLVWQMMEQAFEKSINHYNNRRRGKLWPSEKKSELFFCLEIMYYI